LIKKNSRKIRKFSWKKLKRYINAFFLEIYLDFQNCFDWEVLGKLFALRKIPYLVKILSVEILVGQNFRRSKFCRSKFASVKIRSVKILVGQNSCRSKFCWSKFCRSNVLEPIFSYKFNSLMLRCSKKPWTLKTLKNLEIRTNQTKNGNNARFNSDEKRKLINFEHKLYALLRCSKKSESIF
jgi:hypothetical protein